MNTRWQLLIDLAIIILEPAIVISALLAGGFVGWLIAVRVNMIQIPAMVAFQHGAGGIAFAIRIGGADMPVLISFLNATAGLAASLCGIIIQALPVLGAEPEKHGL